MNPKNIWGIPVVIDEVVKPVVYVNNVPKKTKLVTINRPLWLRLWRWFRGKGFSKGTSYFKLDEPPTGQVVTLYEVKDIDGRN